MRHVTTKWPGNLRELAVETRMNSASIFDLSPSEKLQPVEDLWDALAAAPEAVTVYDWQEQELARRKANLLRNPASGANGQGKVRMSKAIQVRPSMDWRLRFVSTGEISLADHMMTVGRQVHAGQEVRTISIAADAGKGMGSFEDLHGVGSADQFANQINSATLAYYGTPSIAFLDRLVLERDKVAEAAKGFMEKFLKTHVPERASGEVFRAARRFSLVAFAGEYASSLGIT